MKLQDLFESNEMLPPKALAVQTARFIKAFYDHITALGAEVVMITVTFGALMIDGDIDVHFYFYCDKNKLNPKVTKANVKPLLKKFSLQDVLALDLPYVEEHHYVKTLFSQKGWSYDSDMLKAAMSKEFPPEEQMVHFD